MPLMPLRSSATGSPFYYMLPLVLIIFKVTRKNISNKKGMNIMVWFKFKISFFPPVLVDKKYLTKLKLLCCIIFFFFQKREIFFSEKSQMTIFLYMYIIFWLKYMDIIGIGLLVFTFHYFQIFPYFLARIDFIKNTNLVQKIILKND